MNTRTTLAPLLAQRSRFKAFLINRLGSESDAEDVLQNGLIKALHAAGEVRDEEKLTAWFYRILRNALVDFVRSRRASARRDDAWMTHTVLGDDHEGGSTICSCFEHLIRELRPREAELLRRIELGGESVAEVGRSLGMTANHASVTLHRARKALRERLTAFCGECAGTACLDCDCGGPKV